MGAQDDKFQIDTYLDYNRALPFRLLIIKTATVIATATVTTIHVEPGGGNDAAGAEDSVGVVLEEGRG